MSDTESNPVAQVGKWIAQNNLPRILECFDWPEDPYHNRIQKLILERDPVTGRSPFDLTCVLTGKGDYIREFSQRGVPVGEYVNLQGYTGAHQAAAWGRADSLRALYDCNCDVQSRTTFGERPRDIAQRYGHQQCVEFLDWADARNNLLFTIKKMREGLLEQDKSLNKLTKDDKKLIDSYCGEKENWLRSAGTGVTTKEITQAKTEIEIVLQPLANKLSEAAAEAALAASMANAALGAAPAAAASAGTAGSRTGASSGRGTPASAPMHTPSPGAAADGAEAGQMGGAAGARDSRMSANSMQSHVSSARSHVSAVSGTASSHQSRSTPASQQ